MKGVTQMLVLIYCIILSQARRKLLPYLCVPECSLSNPTKAITWPLRTNGFDHPSTSSVTLTKYSGSTSSFTSISYNSSMTEGLESCHRSDQPVIYQRTSTTVNSFHSPSPWILFLCSLFLLNENKFAFHCLKSWSLTRDLYRFRPFV